MAYKNKIYIAFDGDNDINYYYLMKAWKQNDNTSFNFYDAHDLNYARDTSLTESIKNQLRIRFDNSKIFMLLVGENTKYLRKFVPWEIEQALDRQIPIIVVNLNKNKTIDYDYCPKIVLDNLSIHIGFYQKIIEYTLEHWEYNHYQLRKQSKNNPYYYEESLYNNLGIY